MFAFLTFLGVCFSALGAWVGLAAVIVGAVIGLLLAPIALVVGFRQYRKARRPR
ncbi:hypothetical protein [Scleromatobacter humisilvae]|uniref:Uncharacterized protein n=1 Tax=Scleromatobacter humisilvae TaxID=2897159 RepID=A0A9X1YQR2_9BURK|nr:hypothetical protein [Scleromatobacter humisilvae]MCK9689392.1 hypothetical protein [Scleromatobacter humisilvae]